MDQDQRRLLNHEFRRLMTTAGKEKTPFNEIADQLTDLAVRFARSELTFVWNKLPAAYRDGKEFAYTAHEIDSLIQDRLKALGDPEKTCICGKTPVDGVKRLNPTIDCPIHGGSPHD